MENGGRRTGAQRLLEGAASVTKPSARPVQQPTDHRTSLVPTAQAVDAATDQGVNALTMATHFGQANQEEVAALLREAGATPQAMPTPPHGQHQVAGGGQRPRGGGKKRKRQKGKRRKKRKNGGA